MSDGDVAGSFRMFWRGTIAKAFVKVRDVMTMLEEDGWRIVRQRGSHRQLKHSSKPGLVTVPGKPSDDLATGTLNSVLKQAGLKP